MDKSVIAAIERWPDVPAVYGWLSLTARGQWRLHPDGRAIKGNAGQSITNPQILGFINRNYGRDDQGRWFFQNGPQRVYVRLDAAPWIILADDSQGALTTHTGLAVESVSHLWIDDAGSLYLQTEHGPGQLIDRDLPRFAQSFASEDGQALEDWWTDGDASPDRKRGAMRSTAWLACPRPVPIEHLSANQRIDTQLGFVANPMP
jgi:hypothetical protein